MAVALVTGSGSGIGAAVARRLAARGDQVACVDIDPAAARKVAAEIGESRSFALEADVSDEMQCEAMVAATVDRFGDLDAVVTCAGIEKGGDSLRFDADTFRRVVDVNLTGSFLTARESARAMVAKGHGGTIVLIGSINSKVVLPGTAAYASSKGGVLLLGQALAVDFAHHEIRVNIVGPGVTDTPMSADSLAHPERRAKLMARTPLNRPAHPDEIAEAVAFLTSDESSFMTGAFIPVDGGWLAL